MKELFYALDTSAVAEVVRSSTWLFAFTEVIHLIGITLLLGTLSVLDLRLLGLGLKQQTIAQVAEDTYPWTLGGLIVAVCSGLLLFVSEAARLYDSPPFTIKISLFVVAVIFTYTFQLRMTKATGTSGMSRAGGILSLFLWFGVGLAGRAIAFY